MIKTITYTRDIPKGIEMQVAKLAFDYADDLSMNGFKSGQPLFGLDQAMVVIEMGTLMSNMGVPGGTNGGLIYAHDQADSQRVIGFLLYMPLDGVVGECGINYMAVHHEHRRAGVATKLLSELNSSFRQSTLTCQIELVPMYEKLGYKVIGSRDSHVSMTNGVEPSTASMKIFNPEDVLDDPMLTMVHNDIRRSMSQSQIIHEMTVQTNLIEKKADEARAYAENRMAGYRSIPKD
jgi:ribosomal protein S18 acetylase RimI-like enzyme